MEISKIKRNSKKIFFWIGILAIFVVPSFGLAHFNMNMGMDGKMSMSDCPFTAGSSSLCTMSPLEHISNWQNMFTAIPHQDTVLQFLLVLSMLFFSFIFFRQVFSPPKNNFYLNRHRQRRHIFLITYLEEAFSSGILNPKLF